VLDGTKQVHQRAQFGGSLKNLQIDSFGHAYFVALYAVIKMPKTRALKSLCGQCGTCPSPPLQHFHVLAQPCSALLSGALLGGGEALHAIAAVTLSSWRCAAAAEH